VTVVDYGAPEPAENWTDLDDYVDEEVVEWDEDAYDAAREDR
jgi:hypothetical protein